MIVLLLGVGCLLLLMGALGRFSGAQVKNVKQLGVWVAAIGGVLLATMLLLSGRGVIGIAALLFMVPLLWSWVLGGEAKRRRPRPAARPATGVMTPDEARAVLGVGNQASRDEIRAAYLRLMAAAHPDHGGSDWLASRINQARDVLLG